MSPTLWQVLGKSECKACASVHLTQIAYVRPLVRWDKPSWVKGATLMGPVVRKPPQGGEGATRKGNPTR